MPYSFDTTVGDGTTNIVSVPFDYIKQGHVHVYVEGVEVPFDSLTWLTEGTIQLPLAAANYDDKRLLVQRKTPADVLDAQFVVGGLDPADLNSVHKQLLYIVQEAFDLYDLVLGLNISIGTITTLPAGTPATASVGGVFPDLTLSLGLPTATFVNLNQVYMALEAQSTGTVRAMLGSVSSNPSNLDNIALTKGGPVIVGGRAYNFIKAYTSKTDGQMATLIAAAALLS